MKKHLKLIIIVIFFAVVGYALYHFNVGSLLRVENIPTLRDQFVSLGWVAAFAYIGLYIIATLFILPGLPVTLLGGAVFGPLWGTVYTIIGASLGLALGFLASRYAVRDLIYSKFGNSEAFKKIDAGVKEEGWRMLMITRLVPIFPFSIQNYVYGLTSINFFLYWGLSTLFIFPGSAAYTVSTGAVLAGEFSTTNLIYLAIGAILFVLVSLLPKFIKPKSKTSSEN